jgi:type III secretion system YscQ/HrcQ family protein
VSLDALDPAARPAGPAPSRDAGPLGVLPHLSHRQVRLEERLARVSGASRVSASLAWLADALGAELPIDRAEILWRASGLKRAGVGALISWPRLASRLAVGIETPLAHALVDRLLGYDRPPEEGRLQVTPVEWGILTFVVAETLARLDDRPSALSPLDFVLDRVGPDPFNPEGLGSIVTLRWTVRLGSVAGSVRLWVPETLVALWLASEPPLTPEHPLEADQVRSRFGDYNSVWSAEAGAVSMPRGLSRLRVGGVLPIDDAPLRGTPQSPTGPITLALTDCDGRSWFPAEPATGSAGSILTLTGQLRRNRVTREALSVTASTPDPAAPPVPPSDVPVTLAVELGRINLPLRRLADLKPGDVVELSRHAREPVELTSGGRLVARGELVQIDTELGVRVLSVFL